MIRVVIVSVLASGVVDRELVFVASSLSTKHAAI
jgi:hypothetical protein